VNRGWIRLADFAVGTGPLPMHVALVDSSRTVLKWVSRLLEARSHQVHPFTDPHAALEHIKIHREVDALITSAELITMSGIELCWEARLIASANRPLYVILMSSSRDRHRLGEALDSGADDFISKPPVAEELYARLRAAERMTSMQHELIRLAATDPLTGLLNRRAFFERATELCDGTDVLSAIMVDIDHFKRVNDLHGHSVGDRVIRAVAGVLASQGEVVGRLGGEEFVILLKGRTMAEAVEMAERLRAHAAELPFEGAKQTFAVTLSFGVSERRSGDSIDGFLRRADVALYAAKAAGRNRVVADDAALWVANYDQWTSVIRARPTEVE
jgi:two-component system cell cycle response regulator